MSEITSREDKIRVISEQMFTIGNKFASRAMETENTSQAKKAFALARDAYKICLECESRSDARLVDFTMMFLAGIRTTTLRSQVWLDYLSFCEVHGFESLPKGQFFSYVEKVGFRCTKRGSGYVFELPEHVSDGLKKARQRLKALPESLDHG